VLNLVLFYTYQLETLYRRPVNHALIYVLRFEPQPTMWGRIPTWATPRNQKIKIGICISEEIEIQLSVQTAPLENYIYI
jgi:hypothetical protein